MSEQAGPNSYEIHLPVRAETFDDRHDVDGLRIYDASNREVAFAPNPYAHLEIERPDIWQAGTLKAEAFAKQIVATMNGSRNLLAALKVLLTDVEEMFASPEHLEMALSLAKSRRPAVTSDAAPATFWDAHAAITKFEQSTRAPD